MILYKYIKQCQLCNKRYISFKDTGYHLCRKCRRNKPMWIIKKG